MLRKITVSLIALCASAACANAAILSSVQGPVSINKGSGFAAAGAGAEVSPGDQVMTGANGSATVDYGPGCSQSIGSGQVVVVPAAPACAAGAAGMNTGTLVVGGLVVGGGVAAAIALSGGSDKKPISP